MTIHTIMLIMVSLGFVLGVLSTQLCRYAGEYVHEISRRRAMRSHPAGGRGNLHVGTIHVPRSRAPRNDWFDAYLRGEYDIEDQPLPVKVPAQQGASNELPPGWDFPRECSE